MQSIKKYQDSSLNEEVQKNYLEYMQDNDFASLVKKEKLENVAKNNANLIMDSVIELKNCQKCQGLYECLNKVEGYYLYPKKDNNILDLGYVACAYKKEIDKLREEKNNSAKELANARFKEIDMSDKKRIALIKWLKNFYDEYQEYKDLKGLYLHGVFGSGKTYLIYALLNELKINKRVDYIAVYFPQLLKDLKDDWDSYGFKIREMSNVPLLLIDDIGAEALSEWGRDEVLGTILQNRMNNHLPTFFTSNLTIEELEQHLANTKNSIDKVKSRRIIERIKQLTVDLELISENRRN